MNCLCISRSGTTYISKRLRWMRILNDVWREKKKRISCDPSWRWFIGSPSAWLVNILTHGHNTTLIYMICAVLLFFFMSAVVPQQIKQNTYYARKRPFTEHIYPVWFNSFFLLFAHISADWCGSTSFYGPISRLYNFNGGVKDGLMNYKWSQARVKSREPLAFLRALTNKTP